MLDDDVVAGVGVVAGEDGLAPVTAAKKVRPGCVTLEVIAGAACVVVGGGDDDAATCSSALCMPSLLSSAMSAQLAPAVSVLVNMVDYC